MFESLPVIAGDPILAVIGQFRADQRPEKLDLGVGVYKDRSGATPVMRAVKRAEDLLIKKQTSKAYLGPNGDVFFNAAISEIALGADFDQSRVRTLQTPGGSAALRLLGDLLTVASTRATIWVSDPTWANHNPTFMAAGLTVKTYPYFDPKNGAVRFDAMMETLGQVPAGDIVLLHGCCHNPTGANLTLAQWRAVTDLIQARGLLPFVDMAYQGFAEGLDEDAAGLRHLANAVPEMVLALSCSKNFGVYRDRVGAAVLIGRTSKEVDVASENLKAHARKNYSMPPNHGAETVRLVLRDPELTADWRAELEGMRQRMVDLRTGLADALRRHSNSDRFDFIAEHRGMFSLLGLSDAEVAWLRDEHAVYMVGGSRINVAGLPDDGLDALAQKIVAATNRTFA